MFCTSAIRLAVATQTICFSVRTPKIWRTWPARVAQKPNGLFAEVTCLFLAYPLIRFLRSGDFTRLARIAREALLDSSMFLSQQSNALLSAKFGVISDRSKQIGRAHV